MEDPYRNCATAIIEFAGRYPERLEDEGSAGALIRGDRWRKANDPRNEPLPDFGPKHKYVRWGIVGANVYCPIAYLPGVIGRRSQEPFGPPAIILFYATRLADVFFFVLVLAVALKLAPDSRALLASIAAMPMTLQQVSIVSADASVIGVSLLAFAAVLRTRTKPVSRMLLAGLALLFPVWVAASRVHGLMQVRY